MFREKIGKCGGNSQKPQTPVSPQEREAPVFFPEDLGVDVFMPDGFSLILFSGPVAAALGRAELLLKGTRREDRNEDEKYRDNDLAKGAVHVQPV